MLHFFHTWSKWEAQELVRSYHPILGDVGREDIVPGQKRHCLECNIEDIRVIGH